MAMKFLSNPPPFSQPFGTTALGIRWSELSVFRSASRRHRRRYVAGVGGVLLRLREPESQLRSLSGVLATGRTHISAIFILFPTAPPCTPPPIRTLSRQLEHYFSYADGLHNPILAHSSASVVRAHRGNSSTGV